MANDLFIQLEKYGSTGERKQTEDFLTELVRYLLREEPVARKEFIRSVAGDWAEAFSQGEMQVRSQCLTESREPSINGLRLDLVVACGDSALVVENKVDAELTKDQLGNYLRYASECDNRRVAVVSKAHQSVVDEFRSHDRWLGEALWWEIADRWAARKTEFSCAPLIDGVLNFMAMYEMGPIEAFAGEEMKAPELWRGFVEKTDGILKRLKKLVSEPAWPEGCVSTGGEKSLRFGDKEALGCRGILWWGPDVGSGQATFWYFLGFWYGERGWYPPLLETGQPECSVFVGCWGTPKIREDFERKRDQLNAGLDALTFQVIESEDGAVFLCRRRPLKDFLNSDNQPAAILDFFQGSHKLVKDTVPSAYSRHQELLRKPQPGDKG